MGPKWPFTATFRASARSGFKRHEGAISIFRRGDQRERGENRRLRWHSLILLYFSTLRGREMASERQFKSAVFSDPEACNLAAVFAVLGESFRSRTGCG